MQEQTYCNYFPGIVRLLWCLAIIIIHVQLAPVFQVLNSDKHRSMQNGVEVRKQFSFAHIY